MVIKTLIFGEAMTGYPVVVALLCLIGGIQLFCLGIIGEYVGKIFSEVKHRPKFIAEEILLK